MIDYTCADCGSVKSPKGRYCKKCGYKHRKRPSGLKYILHRVNPTWFPKGSVPWNNGTTGVMKAWNKGIKGTHFSRQTEFKKGDNQGEANSKWRGSSVSYQNLHMWVRRHKGSATKCSLCGSTAKVEWANISHKYLRDLNDFVELCRLHHVHYDKGWISL